MWPCSVSITLTDSNKGFLGAGDAQLALSAVTLYPERVSSLARGRGSFESHTQAM